jgi:rhodanese-related sulfurtransferase
MVVSVTPEQAFDMISRGEVDVIDVRAPEEWAGGHVPSARLIPLEQLRANPAANLQHDGVVFVCAGGVRSQTAGRIATGYGFSKVYSVSGGTRSWAKAGLPLVNEMRAAV